MVGDRKNFFEELTDMSLPRKLYSLKVKVGVGDLPQFFMTAELRTVLQLK